MKELKNMNKVTMMKCEACFGLHPIDDCELVTIQIVKGKNCDLRKQPIVNTPDFTKREIVRSEGLIPEGHSVQQIPKKNLIPPGMVSLMTPPGTAGEAFEKRIV